MRFFTILLIAIAAFSHNCKADVDPLIAKRFRYIVQLVKTDNAQELSKWISYPLKRQSPLPDIKNAREFVAYYPTLFDNALKGLLKQYNDSVIFERNGFYGLVGGNFSGEIWLSEDGKISTINYSSKQEQKTRQLLIDQSKKQMHPSVSTWDENLIYARSEKLLVRVDRTTKGLRYACWGKGKTMKDQPDIILYNGVEEAQGTMGGWTWTFINNDWTYVVDEADMCDDPKNCGLFLELSFKGTQKSSIRLKEIK